MYQPWASSAGVRSQMQGNRGRDTKPEKAIRSAVHAMGLRYRVSGKPVAGLRRSADILFTRARVAVFVDGCFWHGCTEHFKPPRTNPVYWSSKIERNRQRDLDTNERLAAAGWRVVRVWEHEPAPAAALRIAAVVRPGSVPGVGPIEEGQLPPAP